jgi:hypothetical protein
LDVESHRRQVADAQAANDQSAEAVALMMLSQAFFEADRITEARQAYLRACQVAKAAADPHRIRLAQSAALMARGLELTATRPASQSAYRAFFSAGVILEELEDAGRAARTAAYAHARGIEEERIHPGRRSFDLPPADGGQSPDSRTSRRSARKHKQEEAEAGSPEKLSATISRIIGTDAVDPAIRDALAHRKRRAEARRILDTDPALARELCIGRPDLPRGYDDGGILDVNHVPAMFLTAFLAALPGFTPELAARVVEARAELGRFTLLSELVVYADVPEELAGELSDRLVFLG